MSDTSGIIKRKNNINRSDDNRDLDNSRISFRDPDKFDIGIKMLKNQREKITNAGKYNERYKNTFAYAPTDKKEFPLSARYRDINGRLILKRNSLSDQGSSDSNSTGSMGTDRPKQNSPNTSPKFEKPIALSSILSNTTDAKKITSGKNSNATQDLNKTGNLSQLTSYRLVSDIKKPNAPNESETPKTDKIRKEDTNIYSIQPVKTELPKSVGVHLVFDAPKDLQAKPIETLDTLQHVQNYISQIEAEEVKRKNLEKFLAMCQKLKSDPKSVPPVQKDKSDKSQEVLLEKKAQEHILVPLKTSNEVENLLKPGVSDMKVEETESFDRSNKIRSSMGGAEYNEKNRNKPLSRAASDVQADSVPNRVVAKPKPRYNRNNSQVYYQVYLFVFVRNTCDDESHLIYSKFQLC